tara:strand:- start:1406 stop:2686 length:1281 start_codon:yes stop_codon:yes gene_type:complete
MSKPIAVVSCPIDTYSGYGARARDFVKALIKTNKYDVKILSQRWGNTRFGYLDDHEESDLASRIIPNLTAKPELWIQITVPNEFQKAGKYNIGVTAGIETTQCDGSWLEGVNRMDLNLVSAAHAKTVFEQTKYNIQDKNNQQVKGLLELKSKVEVLFEGADLTKYFPKPSTAIDLSVVKESFAYLFVGHWMQGDLGEDRKNVGFMIKAFMESFKNKKNPPALILKTMQVGSSIMDRERILDKIDVIRRTVKGGRVPNVYLFHGEVSDQEINQLYNHPKVKAMISFTKGEGFGRPLLEFSLVKKPIIASGWSGHTDFLDRELVLMVGGELRKVHKSAAQKNMILEESSWFAPNELEAAQAMKIVFKQYNKLLINAKKQGTKNTKEFSFDKMTELLTKILDENVPEFPKEIKLTLPKLQLPKLEKING